MQNKDFVSLLKESMHQGMLMKFKKDGYIDPIAFFLQKPPIENNVSENTPPIPVIIPIAEYLRDPEWKLSLAYAMHKMCEDPLVIAAGLVAKASFARFRNNDELGKLVESGAVKISELKNKDDIIMMVFSTPVKEEIIIYSVDVKNKTIGERYPETSHFRGMLINLFGWNKN